MVVVLYLVARQALVLVMLGSRRVSPCLAMELFRKGRVSVKRAGNEERFELHQASRLLAATVLIVRTGQASLNTKNVFFEGRTSSTVATFWSSDSCPIVCQALGFRAQTSVYRCMPPKPFCAVTSHNLRPYKAHTLSIQ